jgi:hypothetical protein
VLVTFKDSSMSETGVGGKVIARQTLSSLAKMDEN